MSGLIEKVALVDFDEEGREVDSNEYYPDNPEIFVYGQDENFALLPIQGEGEHVITATDIRGNTRTVTVVIDNTAPVIKSTSSLKENGEYCLSLTGTFVEKYMKKITVIDEDGNEHEMKLGSKGDAFTMTSSSVNKPVYGNLTIVVEDMAGNKLEVHVKLNAEHKYEFSSREEPKDCVTHGHEYYVCSVCKVAKKVIDLGVGDHIWGEPEIKWSENGKTAVLHVVCEKDSSHTTDIEADITSEVEADPTCTAKGVTKYTATATFNGEIYTDTKSEQDIPALDHTFKGTVSRPATCVEDGEMTYRCERCDHEYTETTPATGKHTDSDNDMICDVCGSTIEKEQVKFFCKMCPTYEKYKDIPIVGDIVTIIHLFVHIAHYISYIT